VEKLWETGVIGGWRWERRVPIFDWRLAMVKVPAYRQRARTGIGAPPWVLSAIACLLQRSAAKATKLKLTV